MIRSARIGLFALGSCLVAVGGLFLLQRLSIGQWIGLAVWLAAAVVLHDAVVAPGLAIAGWALRRTSRRMPRGIVLLIEAGFVVGALLSLAVVPELIAQARGPRNPTVVPGDYLVRLGGVWVAIAALVAVGGLVIGWRTRRVARRRSRS